MAIKYLKKSPKTSSTDDTKTTEIVKALLKDIENNIYNNAYTVNLIFNFYFNKRRLSIV